MESKEEISKILVANKYRLPVTPDDKVVYVVDIPKCSEILYKDMDEYAQQMAIEFAEWIEDNTVFNGEYTICGHNINHITKQELYQIFLNEKQK